MALPFSYNVRNLIVRWRVTTLAIGAIALVVAVLIVLISMAQGFRLALQATGSTDTPCSPSGARPASHLRHLARSCELGDRRQPSAARLERPAAGLTRSVRGRRAAAPDGGLTNVSLGG